MWWGYIGLYPPGGAVFGYTGGMDDLYFLGIVDAGTKLAISAEMMRYMLASNPNLSSHELRRQVDAEAALANYPPVNEAALNQARAASPVRGSAGTGSGNVTLSRDQLLNMTGPQVFRTLGVKQPRQAPAAPVTPPKPLPPVR